MGNYLVGFIIFLWILQIICLFVIKYYENILKNILKKYELVDYQIVFESQWFFQKRELTSKIIDNFRDGEKEIFLVASSLRKKYVFNDFLIFLIFFLVLVLIITSKYFNGV